MIVTNQQERKNQRVLAGSVTLGLWEGPYSLASPGVRRVYTNCCGRAKKGKMYVFCLKKLGTPHLCRTQTTHSNWGTERK